MRRDPLLLFTCAALVLLGWFAAAAEPDAGLLAFRQVSEELGLTVVNMRFVKPLDAELILRLASEHAAFITVDRDKSLAQAKAVAQILAVKARLDPLLVYDRPNNDADEQREQHHRQDMQEPRAPKRAFHAEAHRDRVQAVVLAYETGLVSPTRPPGPPSDRTPHSR